MVALGRGPQILENVAVYVGDGAVLLRPLVRRRGSVLIGHMSVATQLDWCKKAGVHRAIFTHCGFGIVRSDFKNAERVVRSLAHERGMQARLAHDGLTVTLRRSA